MIALGGALGAIARYQLAAMIQARIPAGFPLGTFVVNISGCFVMGVATTLLTERLVVHQNWRFLIPIGFVGAYTTFSTFAYEVVHLAEQRKAREASAVLVLSLVLPALVAGLGLALSSL